MPNEPERMVGTEKNVDYNPVICIKGDKKLYLILLLYLPHTNFFKCSNLPYDATGRNKKPLESKG